MTLLTYLYKIFDLLFRWKVVIFIALIFLVISLYYYRNTIFPKIEKTFVENREFVPEEPETKTATLYYFYTTWCPLSKKSNPEWKALQDSTNGVVKDVNIVFKEVDCDENAALADKFNINGYPTIKLVYNGTTYEYDAKPNRDTLLQFLNSVL
tara:strand:+ start:971 stop:1429 length:459 start_codon:yes stop_codon:yes gene_type:complete